MSQRLQSLQLRNHRKRVREQAEAEAGVNKRAMTATERTRLHRKKKRKAGGTSAHEVVDPLAEMVRRTRWPDLRVK